MLIILLFLSGCDPDHIKDTSISDSGPKISGSWPAWESYETAVWSREEIQKAKTYWEGLDSAAVFVVYQGKVLIAWGNYQVNYHTHSMRKSFMSAVYGIYIDREIINIEKTIAELAIDDKPPLTEDEKRAKIIHLLQARSGVYHTAAAETQGMHDYKPARGTYEPGAFWCYNNWDFNTLATIFDKETETDFFSAMYQDLFLKINMEDYIPGNSQYSYQLDRSIHPAYGFVISARDSARFGLLYLQNGKWNNEQIISQSWVSLSTIPISNSGAYIPGTYYGYMWWIYPEGYGSGSGLNNISQYQSYAALGAYGQVTQIIPEIDLVFVHRTNSFQGNNVPMSSIYNLLNMILAAKR